MPPHAEKISTIESQLRYTLAYCKGQYETRLKFARTNFIFAGKHFLLPIFGGAIIHLPVSHRFALTSLYARMSLDQNQQKGSRKNAA